MIPAIVISIVLVAAVLIVFVPIYRSRPRSSGLLVTRYGLALVVHGRSIHVIPTGDGIGHCEAEDCPCGPVHMSSGDGFWLVEHQTSLAEARR